MKRRRLGQFALGGAAALSGLGAKCRPPAPPVPDVDPDIGKKNRPETLALVLPFDADNEAKVHAALEEHVFAVASPGVHYARLLVIPGHRLVFEAVFDNDLEALTQLIARNADAFDRVLQLLREVPPTGAAQPEAMRAWLKANRRPDLLLYSAFSRGSEPAMREAVALKDNFLRFVAAMMRKPEAVVPEYQAFIEANRARIDTHTEGAVDQLTPAQLTAPDRQNPFSMIFEVSPSWTKRLKDTLKVGQWAIENFHIHPLKQIPTVHYARFDALGDTTILFSSVYDGEWEQYVSDFAVHIPKKLDKVWGGAVGYPKGGAADAPALAAFLEARRLPRDYFYSAQAKATVKELQAALALGNKLVGFSKRAPLQPERLVRHVDRFVTEHQELLA